MQLGIVSDVNDIYRRTQFGCYKHFGFSVRKVCSLIIVQECFCTIAILRESVLWKYTLFSDYCFLVLIEVMHNLAIYTLHRLMPQNRVRLISPSPVSTLEIY